MAKFSLGRVVITAAAQSEVSAARVAECIERHLICDCGYADREDTENGLRNGNRLLSAYAIDPEKPCDGHDANTFWVITEADRSATTILLPSDY